MLSAMLLSLPNITVNKSQPSEILNAAQAHDFQRIANRFLEIFFFCPVLKFYVQWRPLYHRDLYGLEI